MKEFFRNIIDLETTTGFTVEAESLFFKKDDKMILVDDDFYVEFPYNEQLFKYEYSEEFTEEN